MICSICLDEINEETTKLNCVHTFHTKCIDTWFKRSHRCPLCRKSKFDMNCIDFETHYFKESKKMEEIINSGKNGLFTCNLPL